MANGGEAPQEYWQFGRLNVINFFYDYFSTERTLLIKDEDGKTIINVSLSWIHEAPGVRMVYAGSTVIKIQVVDDDQAENLILHEYRNNPDDFHQLIKDGCGNFMYLVSVQSGSVLFEVKTDNFETISSLKSALENGTFKIFLEGLFMRKSIYAAIKGKTLDVSVQIIIPKQLIEVEECVGIAKAAVKEIIELDKQERRQKFKTSERVRDVADVIERAERDENRRRRDRYAAVAAAAAGLALFTMGFSSVAGMLFPTLLGAVSLSVGAVVFLFLKSHPVQISAEDSRKEYVEAVSKYREALLKIRSLKGRDNPAVLSLLDDLEEGVHLDHLRSYLADPSSARVKENVPIEIEQKTFNLEEKTFLELLGKIFNLASSNRAGRTREMATQIERFKILEAREKGTNISH